jgi:hemoglobin-like flavoprotein
MPISDVVASYGRCCVHPAFFDRFYEIFLASDPAIRPMFARTNFAKQKSLLREGVSMLLMHLEGKPVGTACLDRLAESHSPSRMNVTARLYEQWITSLVKTVKEFDDECTADVEAEWRKALHAGVHYLMIQGAKAA